MVLNPHKKPCSCAPLAESGWKQLSPLITTSMNMEVKAEWEDATIRALKKQKKAAQHTGNRKSHLPFCTVCVSVCVSACAVMWVWWIMSLKIPRHWDFSTFKAETVRIGEFDQPCCVHGPAILCERWCKCWGTAASNFQWSWARTTRSKCAKVKPLLYFHWWSWCRILEFCRILNQVVLSLGSL